jgi:thiamine pyrophosphate-dependent acetolactate synthase large subunit-like protein
VAARHTYSSPPPREQAQAEVRALAGKLNAPVGYSLKGKQWLEHDNPNAVGMTGLLGYGGCWDAINHADVLLMLGTDFSNPDFSRPAGRSWSTSLSTGTRWPGQLTCPRHQPEASPSA